MASNDAATAHVAPWARIDSELDRRMARNQLQRDQREAQGQQRNEQGWVQRGPQNVSQRRRKRDRQQMSTVASNQTVIELLDDDDDDVNVIDLLRDSKPVARRSLSPIQDGEVEIVDGPTNDSKNDDRKPPPVARGGAKKNSTAADVMIVDGPKSAQEPSSNVLRVLEIFPDADVEYVKKKLREQNGNIAVVVAVMMSEDDKYPKQKSDGTTNSNQHNSNTTIIKGMAKANEPKHDYSSPSASFETSEDYRTQVLKLLLYDFAFFKRNGLVSLLRQHKFKYTLTRNHIHDMIVGKSPNAVAAAAAGSAASAKQEKTENENYQLLRSVLVRGALPTEVQQRLGSSYCLKKARRKIGVARPELTDPILEDEHYWYEQKFQQWLKQIQQRLRGQAANQQALKDGTAVQCSCCFDDLALSECVPCKEMGHLFCKDCIVQYVESQVFGSGNLGIDKETKKPCLELKCCHGSGCNSGFREEILQSVLPPKTWEKYSEMQTKAQIEQAGLFEHLAMCPKCGYQAEVAETQNIFECPVQDCRFVSCRKCGKAAHIPLRCEEVSQENRQTAGRLQIEEALSEAKMRTCPRCKKKFIKLHGCNKMTCACGMKMCYVCRAPLDKLKNPYSHFCSTPHCDHSSCGKCKMTSNDEEDDAQAMREAGIAAKEAYEQELGKQDKDAVEFLKLNVDEIMANPASKPAAKKKKAIPAKKATPANRRRVARPGGRFHPPRPQPPRPQPPRPPNPPQPQAAPANRRRQARPGGRFHPPQPPNRR